MSKKSGLACIKHFSLLKYDQKRIIWPIRPNTFKYGSSKCQWFIVKPVFNYTRGEKCPIWVQDTINQFISVPLPCHFILQMTDEKVRDKNYTCFRPNYQLVNQILNPFPAHISSCFVTPLFTLCKND